MKVLIGFVVGYLICYVQFYEAKLSGFWALGLVVAGIIIRRFAGKVLDPVADEVLQDETTLRAKILAFWHHHANHHEEIDFHQCSNCHPPSLTSL